MVPKAVDAELVEYEVFSAAQAAEHLGITPASVVALLARHEKRGRHVSWPYRAPGNPVPAVLVAAEYVRDEAGRRSGMLGTARPMRIYLPRVDGAAPLESPTALDTGEMSSRLDEVTRQYEGLLAEMRILRESTARNEAATLAREVAIWKQLAAEEAAKHARALSALAGEVAV